jgi:hypothetical protein
MIAIWHEADGTLEFALSADGRGGVVVADPAPADWATAPYTVVDGVLVPALDVARARQRALINQARDAAQDGGAETPSGRFDSAPRSREFLNGAAQLALMAQLADAPFSIQWTLADNSTVTLDAAEMIAAAAAVAAHVDAMHQRGRVLKARIDAAETMAEIEAVVWTLEDEE